MKIEWIKDVASFWTGLPTLLRTLSSLGATLCVLIGMCVGCAEKQSSTVLNETSANETSKKEKPMTTSTPPHGREIATIAGGCFWCTEAIFRELKGVDKVVSGYAGGHTAKPSYEEVCTGETGHAETIQITFDPKAISYHDLLSIFFTVHNPTTLNQQGADHGTQYRSAIFTHGEAQKETAKQVIKEITAKHIWSDPIVTEVTPFTNFYPAEDYHQDYFEHNPNQGYCQIVIAPKVAKFRQHYLSLLKR